MLNGAFGTSPVTHVAAACGWPAAWSRTVIELLDDLTDITPARHVRPATSGSPRRPPTRPESHTTRAISTRD